MKISIEERLLHFKQPASTSRGVYTDRRIWLVKISVSGSIVGIGECAPMPDLSCDALPPILYKETLGAFCRRIEQTGTIPYDDLRDYPSMLFGLETALLPFLAPTFAPAHTPVPLFDTAFTRGEVGIPINGLVWMGTYDEMLHRMEEKLAQGFRCIKLKIGAINFDLELNLLKRIRQRFSHHEIELRLDANGAFAYAPSSACVSSFSSAPCVCNQADVPLVDDDFSTVSRDDALYKLELLSQYNIHSIEQPICQGQWAFMADLCRQSPLPIALDEELIGINDPEMKHHMLSVIKPAYIVLKPSLHGGIMGCCEWIDAARDLGIGSWITSALESNVGLNAIAQFCSFVYGDHITMFQGLGTGLLFTDNIPMPLEIRGDQLWAVRP